VRILESGQQIIIQKYICKDCGHSFDARPPNYGYGNHFSDEMKKKSAKGRVKTSKRNVKSFFLDLLEMNISHESVRKSVPSVPYTSMESSGYFVYDGQYAHIDGVKKYRTLLKDSKNCNFVEKVIDDLSEESIIEFMVDSLSQFSIPKTITITTDGYHYENMLKKVSRRLGIRVRRQRCFFHIEKAWCTGSDWREEELDFPKKLIQYMFFQMPENLRKLGKKSQSLQRSVKRKSEYEIVQHII
ncbi:MAG: hypothetical protein M0Z77_05325, partial [Thermoplasmatales archaeon]|nr:hypothetical protein [Thermoplasmatales archaeon]